MQDYQDRNNQPVPAPLSKNQKIAVAVLGIFAVFIFIFWGIQFKKNIKVIPGGNNSASSENSQINEDQNSEQALKSKDTDHDGLLDWDELNLYKTSPYLEDSDSDNFKDGEEIAANTDPNCPEGQDCSTSVTENSNISENISTETNLNTQASTSTSQDGLSKILSGDVDAQTLRQLLIEQGMDQELLNQISDEELIKNYQETLSANK